jgi:exosome complex RNA-binding protein Csl4
MNKEQELHTSGDIVMVCPECGEPLIEEWSGVKCCNCDYWFCY